MRKTWIVGLLALLLCGCRAQETFETVADDMAMPVMAQPREILVQLPGETALPTMEKDGDRMYLCENYEIYVQTLEGGDFAETVRTLSGCDPNTLTVMQTLQEDLNRYEFVWAAAGERGDRIGRAVVLDDGVYHYTLSILRDADTTENSQIVWGQIFDSFTLA